MDVVLLFPGQGSQKPGMGKDLALAHPMARAVFDEADHALGTSLSALCFEGPADELTRTHNAQPALLAHGAAVWAIVRDRLAPHVRAAAGHSLGEFTAYQAAGALALSPAVTLVRRRGALMLECGERRPGTMAAILGDLTTPIEAICARATADAGCVVPANYNSPGQVVISGDIAGVERAMVLSREAGARRAVRLEVSGAFHSPLMETARGQLADALDAADLHDPRTPVYANVNAEPVTTAADARRLLLSQLTSPVRWSDTMVRLGAAFPDALFVEMGPGSVLTGLAKRVVPAVATMACGTAADVDHLLSRVS